MGLGISGILLILANLLVSYKGFKDQSFFHKYLFQIEQVLLFKDYKRIITAGFLHVNWQHLLFNLLSLFMFGMLETSMGSLQYLVIYFISMIAGHLLPLYLHRHAGDYSMVGASGAVCGIIFASIAVFPGMQMFFGIPAWIYGLGFVLYSIYGIRSQTNNIGHESHLAGALVGLLLAVLFNPDSLRTNYMAILLIALPSLAFVYMILTRPHLLLVDNLFFKTHQRDTIDEKFNARKRAEEKDIDRILEKIHAKGLQSLTAKEKEMLDQFAGK